MEGYIFLGFLLILAVVIFTAFISLAIYFVPIVIAYIRRHNNFVAITLLTIFTGWTFLGWLAALLWSLNSDVEKNFDKDEDE